MKEQTTTELALLAVINNDVKTLQRLTKQGLDLKAKYLISSESHIWVADFLTTKLPIDLPYLSGVDYTSVERLLLGDHFLMTIASMLGYVDMVKFLLKEGVDINAKTTCGNTALMYASLYGQAEIVKLLLDAGAKVNVQNENGVNALMWASGMGNCEKAVNLLLNAGAKVNYTAKNNTTALKLASTFGDSKIAQVLIEAGAEADYQALLVASRFGRAGVVKVLLDAGVELSKQYDSILKVTLTNINIICLPCMLFTKLYIEAHCNTAELLIIQRFNLVRKMEELLQSETDLIGPEVKQTFARLDAGLTYSNQLAIWTKHIDKLRITKQNCVNTEKSLFLKILVLAKVAELKLVCLANFFHDKLLEKVKKMPEIMSIIKEIDITGETDVESQAALSVKKIANFFITGKMLPASAGSGGAIEVVADKKTLAANMDQLISYNAEQTSETLLGVLEQFATTEESIL